MPVRTALEAVDGAALGLWRKIHPPISFAIGGITFVVTWGIFIHYEGWLIGIILGWLPAAIVGGLVALLWPLAIYLAVCYWALYAALGRPGA